MLMMMKFQQRVSTFCFATSSTVSPLDLRYFNVSTLKELFECVDKRNMVDFIKQTHFYHHL